MLVTRCVLARAHVHQIPLHISDRFLQLVVAREETHTEFLQEQRWLPNRHMPKQKHSPDPRSDRKHSDRVVQAALVQLPHQTAAVTTASRYTCPSRTQEQQHRNLTETQQAGTPHCPLVLLHLSQQKIHPCRGTCKI